MSAGFKSIGQVTGEGVYRFVYDFEGVIISRRYRRSVARAEWRARHGLFRAVQRILRPGDRVRCGRCGGAKPTYTFAGWDGWWAVSKSGIRDLYPGSIDRLNGQPVDFRLLAREADWNERGRISLDQDGRGADGMSDWWVEVALPDGGGRWGAAVMFSMVGVDRSDAEAKLRAIGKLLLSGVIEPGMLTAAAREAEAAERGYDKEGPF